MYAFYSNYIKHSKRDSNEPSKLSFSKIERLYFMGKSAAIILLGFLHSYIAIFFATYSLMCAGFYFKNIGTNANSKKYSYVGIACYFIYPLVSLFLYLILIDIYAPIFVVAAIIVFFYHGQKYANLNLQELLKCYDHRVLGRVPASIQYAIIFILIAVPLVFLLGAQIWGLELFGYWYLLVLFLLIIPAGSATLLFLFKGNKFRKVSFKDFRENLRRKASKKAPRVLKIFLLIYIIVVSMTVVIGISIWGPNSARKETVMIEMSDGTKLATDIYYSPLAWNYITGKPEPAPVILVRTPYGKTDMAILYASLYCAQGYHVVIQDFRGCFDSEGADDVLVFTKDYLDGPETIDWILDKDWCNGKIGSAGISALCITQYLYAGMNPDGLLCQSLWFGTPDLISDALLEGAFHEALVTFWLKGVSPNNWRDQLDIIYDYMANTSMLNSIEARSVSLEYEPNTYDKVNVHAVHVGGWYDHFLKGTIHGYTGYDDRGGKEARGHQKLIIGPYTHGMVFTGQQGELTYPSNANGLPLIIKWETEIFDESLRGVDKDIWSGNRVAYYLMGDVDDPNVDANYWKFAKDWPLDFKVNKWYLGKNDDGDLVVVDDDDDLDGFYNISYSYDPRDPIMTRGGNNEPSYTEKGAGPFDQRPVEEVDGELRDDILLFQSEKFEKPYTVEGDLKVNLFIKSDCNDTLFCVKLCDVYPDGRRMLIIDSALTTRFRVNGTSENFIVPEQEYTIMVNLAATAYQFNTGHRIAVVVTSSNYDRFAINPNTGGPITDHYAEGKIANNTIITGPGKSCIWFPELNH